MLVVPAAGDVLADVVEQRRELEQLAVGGVEAVQLAAVASNRSSDELARPGGRAASAQLHRRARPEHRARRGSRAGRRTSRRDRGGRTASSTMPSRSAHSLIVSWSKSNSSIAVASTIDPATIRSTRRASSPSMRRRSAAVDARSSLCSARNSLRAMVSWFSVAGVSSSRRAATISASALERAAAADRQLGLERSRPRRTTGRQHLVDVVAQRAPVGLRDRVGAHELGGEAGHTERARSWPTSCCWRRRPSPRGCRRRGRSTAPARGRAPPTHAPRRRSGAPPRARRSPRRARRSRRGCGRRARRRWTRGGSRSVALARISVAPAASASSRKRRTVATAWSAAVGGIGTVAAHDVAEAQHLLLLDERVDVAVGVHVGHEEVEGVRPQVHGRDAHHPQATGAGRTRGSTRGAAGGRTVPRSRTRTPRPGCWRTASCGRARSSRR